MGRLTIEALVFGADPVHDLDPGILKWNLYYCGTGGNCKNFASNSTTTLLMGFEMPLQILRFKECPSDLSCITNKKCIGLLVAQEFLPTGNIFCWVSGEPHCRQYDEMYQDHHFSKTVSHGITCFLTVKRKIKNISIVNNIIHSLARQET